MSNTIVEKFQTAMNDIRNQSFELLADTRGGVFTTSEYDWSKVEDRLVRAQGVITNTSQFVDFSGKNAGQVSYAEIQSMTLAFTQAANAVKGHKANWERNCIHAKILLNIEEI
jgi:hypothetical protein